ncbi:cell division protein ZapD [Ectothiorhodospira magna]|uniref:Cell division protein ZapD n=1 Tax=Ectothiorhodospira magna TaxID=867345 RepID=A0A1H8Z8H3_9GAMM|nr:cell division protein ZapD [Ectothiorhodospira magna]SEP60682.1 cell division protein ZapD [Ectothiorhodospira magna]
MTITYEQPLHERVRLFMRLEMLMARFDHALKHEAPPDTHSSLLTLIEMVNLTNRVDVKRELIKELERQIVNLGRLGSEPGVDQQRLNSVIHHHRQLIDTIHALGGQMDRQVKGNDFFNSIRQRTAIPGGTCDFDLPAYHYWLARPTGERRQLLQVWAQPFTEIQESVSVILQLIRNAGANRTVIAPRGFHEQTLDTTQPWQMLRIILPMNAPCYPEISAGKQRFSVRFLRAGDMTSRPAQCDGEIQFTLSCCAL